VAPPLWRANPEENPELERVNAYVGVAMKTG
jgi:hypothetical protein